MDKKRVPSAIDTSFVVVGCKETPQDGLWRVQARVTKVIEEARLALQKEGMTIIGVWKDVQTQIASPIAAELSCEYDAESLPEVIEQIFVNARDVIGDVMGWSGEEVRAHEVSPDAARHASVPAVELDPETAERNPWTLCLYYQGERNGECLLRSEFIPTGEAPDVIEGWIFASSISADYDLLAAVQRRLKEDIWIADDPEAELGGTLRSLLHDERQDRDDLDKAMDEDRARESRWWMDPDAEWKPEDDEPRED